MVEKCQITVVVVVGDFGVLTIQLWKLISFTLLGENIFGWSHSKKHKKIFQNLINFVQFPSEMALQWSLKVQWKLCISGVWTISFRWAISSKEMEIKIEISNFLIKLCCNSMIIAKKPEVNWNFGGKMPNYSCGGCWWFWGFNHSTLKAHIFYTVGRKYFWLVSFKKA